MIVSTVTPATTQGLGNLVAEKSAPMLDTVLANLDGMVYRCRDDANWTMEYVSEGCLRLTGYEPGDLLFNNRISYESITHADDRQAVREKIHSAIQAGHRYEVEYRLIDADGRTRWVQERGAALLDDRGCVTALQGLITDITRIKIAEMRALSAQRRYQSLFDNALEGVFRTTLEGHYLDANQSLATIYGYDSPAALINDVRDISRQLYVNPGRREEFLYQVITHGIVTNFESQVCRCDGKIIWISENVRAIRDEQGKVSHFEGTVEDITAQKQYQQSLIEASEAASAANEAKSAFLANMSHEIRTPMNGVIGIIELLRATHLDRTQREYLGAMRSSADALLSVINDILDFSKIESGKMELECIDMDLHEVVEEAVTALAVQATAKKLELIVDIRADVPERVLGDAQRLRQCLINLTGNAIKFTAQGEVMVRVTREQSQTASHLLFEIRDTGIGIAAEKLATLFEPFVQADSSTTRHFGGTGLGLSIVRNLVQMMGGEVGVNSVQGAGSTFWIKLPLNLSSSAVAPLFARRAPAAARILVVDDNESTRSVIARYLESAGYQVHQADSGIQALQDLLHGVELCAEYAAVLVDSAMPDMSGVQLVESINHNPRLSAVRVAMLTDIDDTASTPNLADMGVAGRLSKPVRKKSLLGCLETVLSRPAEAWRNRDSTMTTGMFQSLDGVRRYTGRVLLVEDNKVNQMVARNLLQRYGCTVEVANNGAEGLALYETRQFDLVFMDMQMPVMDGLTATRKIRDFEGWRPHTPIVALTANATTSQADRCFAAGMDGFLTKPIESERLQGVLDKYLVADVSLSEQAAVDLLQQSTDKVAQGGASIPDGTHVVKASKPLIDWTRFDQLISGDLDFARQLVEVYLDSSVTMLEDLQQAADLQSVARFKPVVHKLRGACANLCADRLHALCSEIENTLSNGAEVSLQTLLSGIREVATATQQEMQRNRRVPRSASA